MLRVVGHTDNLEPAALYLYRDWLPASGEEARDFPIYCRRLSIFPEVPEHETVADAVSAAEIAPSGGGLRTQSVGGQDGVMLVGDAPVAVDLAQAHSQSEQKAVLVYGIAGRSPGPHHMMATAKATSAPAVTASSRKSKAAPGLW